MSSLCASLSLFTYLKFKHWKEVRNGDDLLKHASDLDVQVKVNSVGRVKLSLSAYSATVDPVFECAIVIPGQHL